MVTTPGAVGLTPWFGNVILGVVDLATTAERLRGVGLDVLEGGTHPRFGTRNMIVPLGRSYLELLAVEDPAVPGTNGEGGGDGLRVLAPELGDGLRRLRRCD